MLNIYPDFNGLFSIDTVNYKNDFSRSEFLVSYALNQQTTSVKSYQISSSHISQELGVVQNIPEICYQPGNENAEKSFYIKIHSLQDNSFNLIWSYFNSDGNLIQ